MEILFATGNPYKVREVRQMLEPLGIRVRGLDELESQPEEPVEDGETFAENARKKAVGYAAATGLSCLAEDSGLCVDALGGAPGVRSARYAGVGATRDERDAANNEKLLDAMAHVPDGDRSARFVSAICLVEADGAVRFEAEGTFEGMLARAPHGEGGFGYDPLLFLPDLGRTSAELSPDEKNARSHRGAAMRALVDFLKPSA